MIARLFALTLLLIVLWAIAVTAIGTLGWLLGGSAVVIGVAVGLSKRHHRSKEERAKEFDEWQPTPGPFPDHGRP